LPPRSPAAATVTSLVSVPFTASRPAETVVPAVKLADPDSVSVPPPALTSEVLPKLLIVPLTSVERLLVPTVSCVSLRKKVPAPWSEPTNEPPLEKKRPCPPALLISRACPPVLVLEKPVTPPEL